MNQKAFEGLLRLLSEATNKDLSGPLVKLWWRKFGGVDEATFAAAIERAIDTCTFFPSPVEFTAILEECMTPEERGVQDGIRLLRSWMARGVLPLGWSDEELVAVRAGLGLPPPSRDELRRLAERRELCGERVGMAGPVAERLAGAALPALASGE